MPTPLTPSQEPHPGRQQQLWVRRTEDWAVAQVLNSHLDVMYAYGEYSMFVLMWRADDLLAGLVTLCATCTAEDIRAFDAYDQPTRRRCPDCYGTTFEGGYRARIVRPALWTDLEQDSADSPRGEVVNSTMSVETTSDFTLHTGDYAFRLGGARYRMAEMNVLPVRSGFESPGAAVTVAGVVSLATLEDPSSVAYLIPPSPANVQTALTVPPGTHLVSDTASAWESVRGPLLV